MATTTRQLARLAGISESTLRNYTHDYAELLSPAGRGDLGARAFSDEDVQTILTIAALRKQDVPRAEIIERLRQGDIVIEAATRPQQATTSPQEGHHAPQMLHIVLSNHEAQFVELRRELATVRARQTAGANQFLTGVIVGIAVTVLVAALWSWAGG